MMFLLSTLSFIMTVPLAIFFINLILYSKSFYIREKSVPFECGFDSLTVTRSPLSVHYFLVAVIFLVFDIEIALMIPMLTSFSMAPLVEWMIVSVSFFLILILGVKFEWLESSFKWIM